MANPWIDTIKYKHQNIENNQSVEEEVNLSIGLPFEKIYDNSNYNFTLLKLVLILKTFFNRQAFMLYSRKKPTNYSKTMEWYAITGDVDNIDEKIILDPPEEEEED